MRQIDSYIIEKLHINKDIKIKDKINPEGLPEIDSKVLLVSAGRKTPRESYVNYKVCEILDYKENSVILRTIDTNEEIPMEFRIRTKEEINKIQQKSIDDNYFAIWQKPGFNWARVYDKEEGLKLIGYGIRSLRRRLFYICGGYRLECKGDKIKFLQKVYNQLLK